MSRSGAALCRVFFDFCWNFVEPVSISITIFAALDSLFLCKDTVVVTEHILAFSRLYTGQIVTL